ncbi:MAG: hypothetical protein PHE25_01645 [Candidatus Gracilibacteria bacterium]|nr:hypothetical protein [Candidatus Gracilibacteria bacterium]
MGLSAKIGRNIGLCNIYVSGDLLKFKEASYASLTSDCMISFIL